MRSLERARAGEETSAALTRIAPRARAEPRQITCVKIVDLLSNSTNALKPKEKLKFGSKSMQI
jgi:hypothetical protein